MLSVFLHFRDAIIGSLADGLTSFYAGFVIFAVLGHLATVTGLKISDMADSGIISLVMKMALVSDRYSLLALCCALILHWIFCQTHYHPSFFFFYYINNYILTRTRACSCGLPWSHVDPAFPSSVGSAFLPDATNTGNRQPGKPSPRKDYSKIVKIHWWNLKIFSRTTQIFVNQT